MLRAGAALSAVVRRTGRGDRQGTQAQMIATETHEALPNPGSFDFSTRTVMLNSGYTMPINCLGTYSLHGDECINALDRGEKHDWY